ncbi:MAG: MBL fold metallo-hydrolase [Azoarcus sp.]|jgi:glyoxylase-like metal-dependent hydrolase (beta-lactamase superfamily II)|nr:MBL fold metallo-hydrolase [Azoarcus sp.]
MRPFLPHAAALLACMLVLPFASAQDAPPREIWKAGDMSVTAIQDLSNDMEISIFKGPASKKARAKYFANGKAKAGINVFLLRSNGKVALFDAGAGNVFQAPGKLPEQLASLGVKPEDVDFVLLTHMHADHIGGLLREGRRTFPKAKLLVSKPELDAWRALAENNSANASLIMSVLAAYGEDVLPPFAFGDSPLPGVTAINAVGHTPGHTAFQLAAGGKKLLIVGDLIHAMPLQFALPNECASYDMDISDAIQSRKRLFRQAAQNATPIAGMHFPFENIVGTVKKDGKGWRFRRAR